jgi:hypothetical protein
MRLQPAYRLTYDLEARSAKGLETDSRLSGTVSGDGYELVGVDREESLEVFARLSVTSWQPYEDDALRDALRHARDLCNVLSVAFGNQLAFEPLVPPAVDALEGAKGRLPRAGGPTISVESFGIHMAGADRFPLDAAADIHGDPAIRADLDTWRLAMLESDGPTRLLHYFRIYEREARALMESEPMLLGQDEIASCAVAVVGDLPEGLSDTQRQRVEQSIKNALNRVRTRSRGEVLAEALSQALGREVTADEVGRIDQTRGRYAHEGVEMDTQPSPQDEQLLHDVARTLLRRAIDAHLPGQQSPASEP